MLRPLPQLRRGVPHRRGRPVRDYGDDTREGIADLNRVLFVNELGTEWLPSIADVHARLRARRRVADLGCGSGWSSIAIARAYPRCAVDGFDSDERVDRGRARERAAEELDDRVHFIRQDASDPGARPARTTW